MISKNPTKLEPPHLTVSGMLSPEEIKALQERKREASERIKLLLKTDKAEDTKDDS